MKKLIFVGLFLGSLVSCQDMQDAYVEDQMQEIHDQVASDAEKQYEIAKRSGDDMDAYVQAGLVAAAYLQAKDEVNYKKWKEIEKDEAKNIGIE